MAYFNSPEAFLGSAKPEDFDCILLDYQFNGGMNGMDLLKRLAGLHSSTPVVMVTSQKNALLSQLNEMLRLGLTEILAKPFAGAELLAALNRTMSVADAQDAAPATAHGRQTRCLESPASPGLPRRTGTRPAALPSQPSIAAGKKAGNPIGQPQQYRIAVIDSHEEIHIATHVCWLENGYSVLAFDSPEVFLGTAQAEDFDCIILDCLFNAGMNGMELLKYLAEHHPLTPVIMMAARGNAGFRDAFEMRRLGAKAILEKPFACDELKAVLREAISSFHKPPTDPSKWEADDLEYLNPMQLTRECLPYLLRRAEKNLIKTESAKLTRLTFKEMQFFLLRAQHDEMTDNELAQILGRTLATFQEHIYNVARKLETHGRKGWRGLFDKLNNAHATLTA